LLGRFVRCGDPHYGFVRLCCGNKERGNKERGNKERGNKERGNKEEKIVPFS